MVFTSSKYAKLQPKTVKCDVTDDVIMTSFDKVRQHYLIINHTKFGEHLMQAY